MQPAWSIDSVEDTTIFDPGRGPLAAKRVRFHIFDGTASMVIVPDSAFTKENVAKMVDDAASRLYEVKSLVGPDLTSGPTG